MEPCARVRWKGRASESRTRGFPGPGACAEVAGVVIVVVPDRRCGCESDGRPSTLLEPRSSGASGEELQTSELLGSCCWPLDSGHSGTPVSVRGCDRVVLAEGCGADKWDRDRDAATKTAGLDSAACTSGEVKGRLLASGMRRREWREPASDRGVVRTGEAQAPPTLAPGAPRAAQASWLGRRRPWQHGGSSSMAQQQLLQVPRQHGAKAARGSSMLERGGQGASQPG